MGCCFINCRSAHNFLKFNSQKINQNAKFFKYNKHHQIKSKGFD